MATGISISELRKANGKKLRIFLNQFVSDEDMVFLRNASDTDGIDKSPAALYFTADAISKITNLSPKKMHILSMKDENSEYVKEISSCQKETYIRDIFINIFVKICS